MAIIIFRLKNTRAPKLFVAVAEAGASVLDFGIVADDAGVQGLEAALDNAVLNGADVLITSGVDAWGMWIDRCCSSILSPEARHITERPELPVHQPSPNIFFLLFMVNL